MNKIILITGATAGFGKATAKLFAQNGCHIILTGRRNDRLIDLANKLIDRYNVRALPLCFDVRNAEETNAAIASLPESWKKIDVLVNNAGLASGFSKIQDGAIEDWDKMIDTNVKGLLYVSKAVMPLMISRNEGHIINVGSTAAKEVYMNGNVYCASKHAVDAISKAMRIELLEHGIKVTQINPGAAETEFSEVRFHGDKQKAKKIYEGYIPMSADDISAIIYYTTTLPKNLCINDLTVTSLAQANSFYINRKKD